MRIRALVGLSCDRNFRIISTVVEKIPSRNYYENTERQKLNPKRIITVLAAIAVGSLYFAVRLPCSSAITATEPRLALGTFNLVSNLDDKSAKPTRETRKILGWSLHIDQRLLASQSEQTEKAVSLLTKQLEEIVRVVPRPAVEKLKEVPLYFSPPYGDRTQLAEFHPSAGWLRDNGRDPAMAQAVEFTNIAIFEQETVRMPNFALHELAHAYHFRFLENGFDNADVKATFERAKASGKYEKVERWYGSDRPNSTEKAYALTNAMEYFAESSESYFTKNDFFPFIKSEMREFDLLGYEMIERMWKVESR